ncbi:PREDICTED: molybdenum cofactor sulfurase isoform X1 [Brassica oleracea var. oleracea]|uniref:molybdenum cofactor sulfurase isoform X1 n=1 Tax=Brassica oleracea var. oleracea TaxID=109376 RepID=UPI0006A74C65|nr:PREDICTED: molybdenum cofactor sulfurase isoform X1 [Brassica oleracea var. oleracea]
MEREIERERDSISKIIAMEEFLKEFGDYYGYPDGPKSITEIRETEFKRLDQGVVYLDHAGSTLYSELQMENIFNDFTSSVYGNPHSQSDISSTTSEIIADARRQVLEYFNASPEDYSCVFTSGATAALKIVGETFPWTQDSNFVYTMENHNSVLGIREYALGKGASACAVDIEEAANQPGQLASSGPFIKVKPRAVQTRNTSKLQNEESRGDACNLFAFPSECNFTGLRFNLDLVNLIKENNEAILEGTPFAKSKRWMVLIDAAKGCATQPPNLSEFPADFVVLSFYKLFGYPTGLGALLVRNDAAKLLKKTYFSGGTVAAAIADIDFVKKRERVEEFFEDGSASFLSIAAIRHGFRLLKSLTTSAIWMHTTSLSMYVKKKLQALRHGNGAGVCVLYGSENLNLSSHKSGPTVTFNLKRPDGSWFGYLEVEKLASLSGIQLRVYFANTTGCFCNPGACAKYLDLSHSDLLSNVEAGHVCWDDNDVINGKPTGAVRVSFGYMSTFEEAKKFIDFIVSSFVSPPTKIGNGIAVNGRFAQLSSEELESKESNPGYYLKSVTIYPIKSCAGFSVNRWPLCRTGLLHDREWMIQGLTGELITQKKVPEMSLISTFIDLEEGLLVVESSRCKDKLYIKIKSNSYNPRSDKFDAHDNILENHNEETRINCWFTNAIGRQCKLLQYSSSTSKHCLNRNKSPGLCRVLESNINFANEAQFLLISEESVADLNIRLEAKGKDSNRDLEKLNPHRFRPNLVIAGGEPYAEDKWRTLKIGDGSFTSLGGCNRCQMINISNESGQVKKSNEPLTTLASYRRVKGKILFGTLLRYEHDAKVESWIRVGEAVNPDRE